MRAPSLELPTLRLATLRRVLAGAHAPLVFDLDTPLVIVEDALRELPLAKVALVDRQGALRGVLTAPDVPTERDCSARSATAMITRIVVLEPEQDVEAALAELHFQHADYVVVALGGELLGVLSRAELEHATRPRRAA